MYGEVTSVEQNHHERSAYEYESPTQRERDKWLGAWWLRVAPSAAKLLELHRARSARYRTKRNQRDSEIGREAGSGNYSRLRAQQSQEQTETRDDESERHDRDAGSQPREQRALGSEIRSGIQRRTGWRFGGIGSHWRCSGAGSAV